MFSQEPRSDSDGDKDGFTERFPRHPHAGLLPLIARDSIQAPPRFPASVSRNRPRAQGSPSCGPCCCFPGRTWRGRLIAAARGSAEGAWRSWSIHFRVHFRVHFRFTSAFTSVTVRHVTGRRCWVLLRLPWALPWVTWASSQLGPKRGQLGRTGRKLLRTAQPLRPPSAPSAVVTRLPDSRRGPQRARLPAGSLSVILRGERVETSRPRRPRAHLPDARHTPMKPSPCPAPPPSPSRSLTSATVFQALQVMSSPVELHSPALSLTEQVNESFLTGERILNQVREICLIFLFFLTASF